MGKSGTGLTPASGEPPQRVEVRLGASWATVDLADAEGASVPKLFDDVVPAPTRMPLLPHPAVLFWRISAIRLRVIDPPLMMPAIWMPLIVEEVPVEELMPEMTF